MAHTADLTLTTSTSAGHKSMAVIDETIWPGPAWEPTIHKGAFPAFASPGDLYCNFYGAWYYLSSNDDWIAISPREIHKWVTGGLMKRPGPDQPNH